MCSLWPRQEQHFYRGSMNSRPRLMCTEECVCVCVHIHCTCRSIGHVSTRAARGTLTWNEVNESRIHGCLMANFNQIYFCPVQFHHHSSTTMPQNYRSFFFVFLSWPDCWVVEEDDDDDDDYASSSSRTPGIRQRLPFYRSAPIDLALFLDQQLAS